GAPPGAHYGAPARSWLIKRLDESRLESVAWDRKNRGGAPGGAPPRSQGEAARLASVPGGFAGHPGASQAPRFPALRSPRLTPQRSDGNAQPSGGFPARSRQAFALGQAIDFE